MSNGPAERRSRWRSLRAQVLLWTVLPLTILLIAVSLTGVGTHQGAMRTLAAEENRRFAGAVALGLAQQVERYATGLEAAARLSARHAADPAMRQIHLDEASAVLEAGIVQVDAQGSVVASSQPRPPWAAAAVAQAGGGPVAVAGDHFFVRAAVPGEQTALIAGVPLSALALDAYLGAAAEHRATLSLLDAEGRVLRAAARDGNDAAASGAAEQEWLAAQASVQGANWTVEVREAWHAAAVPLIRFEQAMPFVLLVAAAVSFLTLYSGLRLVVRPLRRLAAQARAIGEGDFAAAATPVGGVNEIERVRVALDQMAARLQSYQRNLERHLQAVTQAQEEERARLARELHDETAQGLVALDHRLQRAQRTLQRDPNALHDEVAELRRMVKAGLEEVRRFSRALRPLYLEDLGLGPALEALAREMGASFTLAGEARRLDPNVELALYRTAQEALSNARRHAQAARVEVQVAFSPGSVAVRVCDDGVGFTPPAHLGNLTRTGHFGLLGIYERAQLIGAELTLTSAPRQGTCVAISVDA
jgi:signal transduction histidine kinase